MTNPNLKCICKAGFAKRWIYNIFSISNKREVFHNPKFNPEFGYLYDSIAGRFFLISIADLNVYNSTIVYGEFYFSMKFIILRLDSEVEDRQKMQEILEKFSKCL